MSRTSRASTPRVSKAKPHEEFPNVPFPEWQDSDVTGEKWEIIREVKKHSLKRRSICSKKSTESVSCTEINFYIDIHGNILPPSIEVNCWKRLSEIYENVEFVISKQTIDFAALTEGSKHILHSEFMRAFVSSIGILEYISTTRPWRIESVTNSFTPNTENVAWKPWHHVYSHCGAGKGIHHNPKYNPSGKYIVRLHWLGCWRKVYVDDRVPVDIDQNILLPGYKVLSQEMEEFNDSGSDKKSLSSRKSKKSKQSKYSIVASEDKTRKKGQKKDQLQVEIWPYILTKALLKIACLSWTSEREVVDFSPISCLTGWICQKVYTSEMDSDDIWKICVAYSPKFEWPQDEDTEKEETDKGDKTIKETESKSSKTSKKKPKKEMDQSIDETKVYCLIGSCSSITNFMKDLEIGNIPNEWNQNFLIEQSRNVPLIKPQPRPELPRWKRFRWIYWAIAKGLWPDDEFAPPIRCLKFFNNFKKDEFLKVSPTKSEKKESKKSPKGKKKKNGGELKIFPLVDKSIWVDFAEVEAHIQTLSIFFRPSQFNSFIKLSNLIKHNSRSEMYGTNKDKAKKDGTAKICQEMKWTLNLKDSRNEPIYLLMESLDPKLLVINLCQIGYVDRVMIPQTAIHETPYANIVLESYSWNRNKIGRVQVFLTTAGSKSVLLYLNPGRIIFKLWIWCNSDYFINILSNSQVIIGNVDSTLEAMNIESLLLGRFAQEVGIAFGNLVQAFGKPSYMDEMRKFNGIYKSNMLLNKIKSKELYTQFMNLLLKHIESKQQSFALKVLFLDPNICYLTMKSSSDSPRISWNVHNEFLDEEDILELKAQENAAVKIQSIFKTIFIQKILKRHVQGSREHNEIYDDLKQVYYDIFSDTKRSTCMKMLKDFYFNNESLKCSYLYNDLLKVIDIKSLKGYTVTIYNTWVFIIRQKFINRSSEPLIMRTILHSNLPKYVVRIFNNDTGEEVKRITNHAETCSYPPNMKGFTILCYGWTTEAVKITWKLCLIFLKKNTPSFITAEEHLDTRTMTYCYNPNVHKIICKCRIEIRHTAEVTIRLSTSSAVAEIDLAINDSYNKTLAKVQGKHNVILPFARLKWAGSEEEIYFPTHDTHKMSRFKSLPKQKHFQSKDKIDGPGSTEPSIYYVEAKVLNNTWPLTKKEWLNVKTERKRHLMYPPVTESTSQKLTKKKTTAIEVIENPYWSLQVIHNVGENLTVERDLTRQNEINNIKQSWYEKAPGRYEKSQDLRETYLQMLSNQACEDSSSDVLVQHGPDSDTTLNKWIPETLMSPPFDITKYYSTDANKRRCLNMNEWENILLNKSVDDVNTLCYTLYQCRERMDKLSSDQIENFVIFRQWYDDCRKDSEELMVASYNKRDEFINMIIEEDKKAKEDTKEKKTKKTKGKEKKVKKKHK